MQLHRESIKHEFVANLPLRDLPVKEFFFKSVDIWGSYGKSLVSCLFVSRCRSFGLQCFDAVGWATGRASGL